MLYCVYNARYPVEYLSCGNLISEHGFLHDRRNIDSFVLIMVQYGTLHIAQNDHRFSLHENEALILFPHQTHYGFQPSSEPLSYYWAHFYITDPDYRIYSRNTLLRSYDNLKNLGYAFSTDDEEQNAIFICPEHFRLDAEKRALVLFRQLLDMAKRDHYRYTWRSRYALNVLLAEYHAEFVESGILTEDEYPCVVTNILEWIRAHYTEEISVSDLVARYNYNPKYVSALIKKYTGFTINELITQHRINAAKKLLSTNSLRVPLAQIASQCGYSDEKYFMRVFRKLEKMTPTEYRMAFHEQRLVTK